MEKSAPLLEHLPPVARRRLSQLSRMVLYVGHRLLEERHGMRTYFCSRFGEIVQQKEITGRLIDQGDVRPSAFSLSVFNTPVSLLSIHEGIREGISVLLAGENSMVNGLAALLAQMERSPKEEYLLLFADEMLPEEYRTLTESDGRPFAFGLILSSEGYGENFEYDFDDPATAESLSHPLDLLRWILSAETTGRICCNKTYINLKRSRIKE